MLTFILLQKGLRLINKSSLTIDSTCYFFAVFFVEVAWVFFVFLPQASWPIATLQLFFENN